MNDKNITTNFITSTLNSKQFYIISFIILVISIGLILSEPANKMENNMAGMDMKMMKHPVNFGPGDAFHIHKKVDPKKFEHVADISKQASDLPPPVNRKDAKTVEIKLIAKEVVSDIAAATPFHYWTFDNTVPGPFLRVRLGDTIKLTLHNDVSSSHDHSIDLHAVTGPGGGAALTTVEPGKQNPCNLKHSIQGYLFITVQRVMLRPILPMVCTA